MLGAVAPGQVLASRGAQLCGVSLLVLLLWVSLRSRLVKHSRLWSSYSSEQFPRPWHCLPVVGSGEPLAPRGLSPALLLRPGSLVSVGLAERQSSDSLA